MNMDKRTYARYVEARAPRTPLVKNSVRAFLVGGGICFFAEGVIQLLTGVAKLTRDAASLWTAMLLIGIAVLLTALGVFDRVAQFAGGGTLLPITGFFTAVASPAIDSRCEGLVLGIGSKIFTVAGPVLLYGTVSGTVYGVIYWVCTLFWR